MGYAIICLFHAWGCGEPPWWFRWPQLRTPPGLRFRNRRDFRDFGEGDI
jgi:hypothetical protein